MYGVYDYGVLTHQRTHARAHTYTCTHIHPDIFSKSLSYHFTSSWVSWQENLKNIFLKWEQSFLYEEAQSAVKSHRSLQEAYGEHALLFDEDRCQTLKQLPDTLNITEMAVNNRLHTLGLVKKAGNWLSHELSERLLEKRRTI